MNANTHKLVTPGCPRSSVGNDPSGRCCETSHLSAWSIDESRRRHSSGVKTFDCGSSAPCLTVCCLATVSSAHKRPHPATNKTKPIAGDSAFILLRFHFVPTELMRTNESVAVFKAALYARG